MHAGKSGTQILRVQREVGQVCLNKSAQTVRIRYLPLGSPWSAYQPREQLSESRYSARRYFKVWSAGGHDGHNFIGQVWTNIFLC